MIMMGQQATLKKTYLFTISFLILLAPQSYARTETSLSVIDLESILRGTAGLSQFHTSGRSQINAGIFNRYLKD